MTVEDQLRKAREITWDKAMARAKQELDFLVLATPTGVVREKLTEAAMMLGWADRLEKTMREGDVK